MPEERVSADRTGSDWDRITDDQRKIEEYYMVNVWMGPEWQHAS